MPLESSGAVATQLARALVDRVSLRKAAKRVNVHLETSFRWRHRFLATARNKRPSLLSGIIEADETLILKSAKGSRQLVGRAPRKRGGKPKKTGTSPDDYDIVLIARDRHKATSDHILYDFEGSSFDAALAPLIERDAVLVTDGRIAAIGRKLAADLAAPVVAGETLTVRLVKPGREPGQGVGFLDDGSMVVVNGGAGAVGAEPITVTVSSVVPNAAGRIVFARPVADGRAPVGTAPTGSGIMAG